MADVKQTAGWITVPIKARFSANHRENRSPPGPRRSHGTEYSRKEKGRLLTAGFGRTILVIKFMVHN